MEIPLNNTESFLVLASDKSKSALRIRKPSHLPFQQGINHNFIFQMKQHQGSLEIKRGFQKNIETIKHQNSISKRLNLCQANIKKLKFNRSISELEALKILQAQECDFFNDDQFTKPALKNENYNPISSISRLIFPDISIPILQQTSNELLSRSIEIMSNLNQKISIPIHEGLYRSNTAHKSDLDKKNIPKFCDFKMKNEYSDSMQFIREYKSGYTPIEMQKRNNEEVYESGKQDSPVKAGGKDKTRNHFIRKQQSTLTLPRTCGVSYIKPSESLLTQREPFQPLPPLIFQGSTSCAIGLNEKTQVQIELQRKELINGFNLALENSWLPFIVSDEDEMRDLLLGKKTKNAKVGFVEGIQKLWPLYAEGVFILILISPQKLITEQEVWQTFLNKQTYFKIGILSKKSTSGRKAFLKSIKVDPRCNSSVVNFETELKCAEQEANLELKVNKANFKTQESSSEEQKLFDTFEMLEKELKQSRTVITMSLRLQMYVEEIDWKQKYSRESKDLLNDLITSLKDKLEKKSIRTIGDRFDHSKQTRIATFEKKFEFLRICRSKASEKNIILSHNRQSVVCGDLSVLQKKDGNLSLPAESKAALLGCSSPGSVKDFLQGMSSQQAWRKSLKFPLYYISTRDSFAFDLIEKRTVLRRSTGRQYTRIDYYFYPENVPTNFGTEYRKLFPQLDVGVTAYHGFFSEQEMEEFEDHTFALQQKAFKNKFLQMTVQPSIVSSKIKRTKFFFGYRYMWTRCQLSEHCSYVGAGVRKDVAKAPAWTYKINEAMVKDQLVQNNFINSIAINVYHDGKEGLAQHFDDAVRFKQPIYTLRLFSDARLSFGSQFYGFCNGAFIIPLPRGCILVMEQNSYAANGVKHCVRPSDMTGKSAAIILRQMHSQVVREASKYDELIDFPSWLSCLTEEDKVICYAQQKRLEAEQIMREKESDIV